MINEPEKNKTPDESPEESQKEKGSTWKSLGSSVIIGLVCFLVFRAFLGPVMIPTGSMEPTVNAGDRIMEMKTRWDFLRNTQAKYGNIVTFTESDWAKATSVATDTAYLKRIMALPGDTIGGCTDDGKLIRNGQGLDEPYLKGSPSGCEFPSVTVPEGKMWMMGDNREYSRDTRWQYLTHGNDSDYIPDIENMTGKQLFVFPF